MPTSGYSHYPLMSKVIPLYVSACRNADRECRLPKIPSMVFRKPEKMRRLPITDGGEMSTLTSFLMINFGPI